MRNIFIFHGTGGNPDGNWFPWLKKELEALDCIVTVPRFPTPNGQSLEAWLKVLDQFKNKINDETIFIGHSLGGLFLLRVLERLEKPIFAAFFVSAPVGIRPIRFYDSDYSFSGFSFDFEKIKKQAKHFVVFHSDNDPYISLGNGKELASNLGVELNFIPNAGHLNAESGYTEFNKLLEEIKKLLN